MLDVSTCEINASCFSYQVAVTTPAQSPQPTGSSKSQRVWKNPILRWVFGTYARLNRWNKVAVWLVLAAIPFGVLGYHFARPAYRHIKQANALRMAERFAKEGDMASASMSFRRAIRTNPKNPEVWRRVAAFLEDSGASEVVDVWEQLAALEPDVAEHRFKLAEKAIAARRFDRAIRALDQLPASDREKPEALKLMATLALAKGDFAAAAKYLDAIDAAGAGDETTELQRLLVDVNSADYLTKSAAIQRMDEISREAGERGAQANRELIGHAVRSGDLLAANRLAERLIGRDDARLTDRLSHFELELATQSFTIPNSLQAIRKRAEENVADLPMTALFLARKIGPDAVANWLNGLPEDLKSTREVQTTQLELALNSGATETALAMLKAKEAGATVPESSVELAAEAIQRYESGGADAEQTWTRAVLASEGSPEALGVLGALAMSVPWPEAQAKALWALVARAPQHRDSWLKLAIIERAQQNSAALLSALEGLSRSAPDDLSVRNDTLLVRLLLRRGNPTEIVSEAEALVQSAPGNPVFATTLAFALAQAGRADEAVAIMEQLPERERMQRNRALYLGTIYALAGQKDEALLLLDSATPMAEQMIPEERALLAQARNIATGQTQVGQQAEPIARTERSVEDRARIAEEFRRQREEGASNLQNQEILETIRSEARRDGKSAEEVRKLLEASREGRQAEEE